MASYLGFNYNPAPTTGQGAYGAVPGQTGIPPSIWDETNAAVPGMEALTTGTATAIGTQLGGKIQPGTMMNLGNAAAARGISLGQPNSPLSNEIGLNLIGNTSETLTNQGIGNYLSFLGGVGSQQLDPNLTSTIAQSNALLGAAPDPSQAVSAEQAWLQQYMSQMNPAGRSGGSFTPQSNPWSQFNSPSGGTGTFNTINYGGSGGSPYTVYNTGGYGQNNVMFD